MTNPYIFNTNTGEPESEQHLIASLTSARNSIASLDQANKELLEALENSQEEIERLSIEGMNLQQRFRLKTEIISKYEDEILSLKEENKKLSEKLKLLEKNDHSNQINEKVYLAKNINFN